MFIRIQSKADTRPAGYMAEMRVFVRGADIRDTQGFACRTKTLILIRMFRVEYFLHFLAYFLGRMVYRIRVSGTEHIPKKGAAILICNHVSFVDWLIIYSSVPRPVRFVMDKSYNFGPLAWLFRAAKVILIATSKEDPEAKLKAYSQIREELHAGEIVCIFPEGTITRTGRLQEFRPGVLKMVKEIPVPVVPMALSGLWGSLFSRKDKSFIEKRPRKIFARVFLKIGPPIQPQELSIDSMTRAVVELWTPPSDLRKK